MLERKPYIGATRQLVLAFDIGTTCSGISFCVLQPGHVPQPQGVLRYPNGQGQTGDIKVPSVIYYDAEGYFRAAGYEAFKDEILELAESEGWVKLEWWKLHFRPKHLSSAHIKDSDIPPLPKGKTAVDVLADFIRYLYQCAETYIKESYPDYIWESVKDTIRYIFTHPNGWEGAQQQQIRCAIELAGLVQNTAVGRARVRLLTEGEAGLHFCIWDLFASGLPAPGNQRKYPDGQGIVVIDAGGGTLDLSMYSMKLNPTSFEEIAPAECRLQGSVFVSRRAKHLLQRKLLGSRYGTPDMIDEITDTFDRTTKHHVSNAEHPAYIKVGSLRENDVNYGIRAGKLKLFGQEATGLFNESVRAIISAFEEQRRYINVPITMAFLIGGFGANDWLWAQLYAYFVSRGIELSRPSRVHKAVPDGALSHFIDNLVTSRVARATYGIECGIDLDETNPEHLSRKNKWTRGERGHLLVPDAFQGILQKGAQVHELREFRRAFCVAKASKTDFGTKMISIVCYRGALQNPQWMDHEKESFSTLCTIDFDASEAARALAPRRKLSNQPGVYYHLDIDVIILFGATEFSAQVAWQENGIEKRSPAAMIYDDD